MMAAMNDRACTKEQRLEEGVCDQVEECNSRTTKPKCCTDVAKL